MSSPVAPGELILNGVTVVDTRSGELTPKLAVALSGGKIVRIAPADSLPRSGANVVDAPGRFVVPGFLDMHAHVLENEHREHTLAVLLAHGVTGWRQMAGSPALLEARRQGRLQLGPEGPELLQMPGQILTVANAPSPEAALLEVSKQKAEGADFIKTISVSPETFFASLAEAKRLGLGYAGHLSVGVSAEKAAAAGMRAIEHLGPLDLQLMSCSSRGWLVRLILALRPPPALDLSPEKMETVGKLIVANPVLFRLQLDPAGLQKSQRLVDTFSEGRCRRLAGICVAHGTWQVPSLIRLETMQLAGESRFSDDPQLRYIPRATRQFWSSIKQSFAELVTAAGRETLQQMTSLALRMTKIFDECGVKMLTGSDFGGMWVIPGVSLHQEFDLLEKAGLSPLRVLQMATLDGAEFLHREATLGSVEVGKDANLVLLDRNPIESVQNLHSLDAVVRAGRYYPRAALETFKSKAAEALA